MKRKILTRLSLPGSAYGIASNPATGEAWVTLVGRNELVYLSARGGRLRILTRLPTARQPNTVAVDDITRCVFITGTADSDIQRVCREDAP